MCCIYDMKYTEKYSLNEFENIRLEFNWIIFGLRMLCNILSETITILLYSSFITIWNDKTSMFTLTVHLIYNEITKKPVFVSQFCALFYRRFKCLHIKCSWHHFVSMIRSFMITYFPKNKFVRWFLKVEKQI